MSETRERILQFIKDFWKKEGYSPAVREIQAGCHISSTSVVQYHLDILAKQGRINKKSGKKRTITLP